MIKIDGGNATFSGTIEDMEAEIIILNKYMFEILVDELGEDAAKVEMSAIINVSVEEMGAKDVKHINDKETIKAIEELLKELKGR